LREAGCPRPPRCRSQVFSTSQRFQLRPSSTALFHAATVPGLPSFRAFPSPRSRARSQAACAPLQSSTMLGDASPSTLSPPVSPTPTFERGRLDPPTTMGPLFTRPKPRFPVALGRERRGRPLRQLHLLRSLDPSLSPFALTRASPSRVADALLVFRPSKDTYRPSLGTSNPPEPSRARALPGPRRNRLATQRTVWPPAPGGSSPTRRSAPDHLRRQYPALFRTGPHRLSAAPLLP
jgi:hypothetical protein